MRQITDGRSKAGSIAFLELRQDRTAAGKFPVTPYIAHNFSACARQGQSRRNIPSSIPASPISSSNGIFARQFCRRAFTMSGNRVR